MAYVPVPKDLNAVKTKVLLNLTKRQLIDELWDLDSDVDEHTVEVHISRLREKFRGCPDFHIRTIRGFGYMALPGGEAHGK